MLANLKTITVTHVGGAKRVYTLASRISPMAHYTEVYGATSPTGKMVTVAIVSTVEPYAFVYNLSGKLVFCGFAYIEVQK
jgi:hypothetical protein